VAPDPRAISVDDLACAARCRIECAGAAAESACFERGCAALEHPDDICGPASYDFHTPLRAVAARESVRDGNNPFTQAHSRARPVRLVFRPDPGKGSCIGAGRS
jgi:hypothetical protein